MMPYCSRYQIVARFGTSQGTRQLPNCSASNIDSTSTARLRLAETCILIPSVGFVNYAILIEESLDGPVYS